MEKTLLSSRQDSLDLEFLYYFSNPSICVLETRINGLEEGTPPDRVYHWLCYDRASQMFQKLGFKSMESEGGRNHRTFEQGQLWFDASQANLRLETGRVSGEYALDVNEVASVPDDLICRVQHFLQDSIG